MKSTLKLELVGDSIRQQFKLSKWKADQVFTGLGQVAFGSIPSSSWVAEIIGFHAKFKYDRKFLNCKKDYSHTNSKGSRGVYAWYILESGRYYEIKEAISWSARRRYFVKVDVDGTILEVEEDEVSEWLKDR